MGDILFLLAVAFGAIIGWYICWRTEVLPRVMVIMQHKRFIHDEDLDMLWERYRNEGEGPQ